MLIVPGSLVVESVSKLMPESHSSDSIFGREGILGVEVRELKLSSRHHHCVQFGRVVCVDCLRGHGPAVRVSGFTNLLVEINILEATGLESIAKVVVVSEVKAIEARPMVREPYGILHILHLQLGFLNRLLVHPNGREMIGKGFANVVEQVYGLLLPLLTEVGHDVVMAQQLPHLRIRRLHTYKRAIIGLRSALEDLFEEVEVLGDEFIGQKIG
mmetsp:Transcript_41213/g.66835  ORF Transcript_41213/g.66835 Transcript_41213/m.66835 type:complete len:214 (-) Transcript_41213:769-1410(-)